MNNFRFKHVKRALARRVNDALKAQGLRLDRVQQDFDDRPMDAVTRRRVVAAMAEAFESWIARQTVFDVAQQFDIAGATAEFFEQWLDTPFRARQGGSRFNNLLWLHLIARSYDPQVVVDSGTFQGASAWALACACPTAKIFSFDIDLSRLRAPLRTRLIYPARLVCVAL